MKGRLVIMDRYDYDEVVAIIHEADEVERMCLTNHDRTQKALKLLKKALPGRYPWVVVEAGDGFICARNGKDGTPETGYHYYVEWQDAQQEADWNNQAEGITDAPRFDDDD